MATKDHIAWLLAGLQQPGKTQKGLGKALGVDESGVSKMLKNKRRLQIYEIPKAAAYLGIPEPGPAGPADHSVASTDRKTHSVPVTKIACGGVWREEGVSMVIDAVHIPHAPEPRLEGLIQYATRIDGTDFNKVLRPGDYAIFVPFADVRSEPRDGDIVEVQRHRGSTVETAVRRVRIRAGAVELWPESDDPARQTPSRLGSNNKTHRTEITGLFVGLYRPAAFSL